MPRRIRSLSLVGASIAMMLGLTACASTPAPAPTPTGSASAAPVFVEGGGAEVNHAYFDDVLQRLLAATPQANSHQLVDALTEAGFDKTRMEVTLDVTTAGLNADYVIVSVKMPDDQCLIGQRGTQGYSSMAAAPLSTGKCLIGETQQITW